MKKEEDIFSNLQIVEKYFNLQLVRICNKFQENKNENLHQKYPEEDAQRVRSDQGQH